MKVNQLGKLRAYHNKSNEIKEEKISPSTIAFAREWLTSLLFKPGITKRELIAKLSTATLAAKKVVRTEQDKSRQQN